MNNALPEGPGTIITHEVELTKLHYERLVGMYAIRATVFLNQSVEANKKLKESEDVKMKALIALNAEQLYSSRMASAVEELLKDIHHKLEHNGIPNEEWLKDLYYRFGSKINMVNTLKPNRKDFTEEVQLAN